MEIRFLAISGSERTDGNTDKAIGLVQKIVESKGCLIDKISLKDLNIIPCCKCVHAENCNFRKEPCDQNDDAYEVLKKMISSDCIIYVTPVHGFGLSSIMQNFIERMGVGYLRFERPLTNKIGGIIAVGRRYSHDAVFSQIIRNLLLNRMILIGSGFPAFLNGGQKGDIFKDKEGLDSVYRMSIRMYDIAMFIKKAERKLGILFPPTTKNEKDFIFQNYM